MMKIFLGNSPFYKEGFFGVRAGSRWPHFEKKGAEYLPFPFFLAYASSCLEKKGFEVMLLDGIAEKITEEEFIDRLVIFNPELIFLEVSTISIKTDLALAKKLKKILGSRVKVALGGLHFPMYHREFMELNSEIDFIFKGEYEIALSELAANFKNSDKFGIKGLIWKDSSGQIFCNHDNEELVELDELPWPARHHLPMFNYRDEPGNIPRPSVQIWTSRGCPYGCSFCVWPQIMYKGKTYRTRSVKDIVDEIEWLFNEYNFKSFYIDDDTFNIDKQHVLSFCSELEKRRLNIPWAAMARADLMNREILERLCETGLRSIKYGIESADQNILKNSGKRLDLEKSIRMIQVTKSFGIKYHLTFMFGLPGETLETAKKTLELALKLYPDSLQFTLATPFPGSSLYNQLLIEKKLLSEDFSRYDGFNSAVISTENLSAAQLEEFIREANRKWNKFRYGVD